MAAQKRSLCPTQTPVEMTPDEARETDSLIKRHINTTRYLLLDMRDRKGWKALGYASFKEYGEKELKLGSAYVYRLAESAEIALHIGFSPIGENQPKESQLRPLTKVPEAERKAIWEEATRKAQADNAKLTAQRVEQAVADYQQRLQALETQVNALKAPPPVLSNLQEERMNTPVMDAPPAEMDDRHCLQQQLDATRHQLHQLGERLMRGYKSTGNPFSHACESEIQQWNDLADLMRQAAESIQSFTTPQRPTLTLIQGHRTR